MAAGLLVLLGLGLFVGGILTGTTAFYWGCVAACAVAAALLFLARRQGSAEPAKTGMTAQKAPATGVPESGSPLTATPATTEQPAEATARRQPEEAAAGEPAEKPAGTPQARAEAPAEAGEPPLEEVEVTDLLLIVDLTDDVLVVDEHPRYHLEGCRYLAGQEAIPLPLDEARTDGFTPCGTCTPDRKLAERARARN